MNAELVARYFESAAIAVLHVETARYVGCCQRASLQVVNVQSVEVSHDDLALR